LAAARAASIVLLLTLFATACGGSGDDKAGGEGTGKPVVLTLAVDYQPEAGELAELVERHSNGSVRIEVRDGWRVGQPRYEERTIGDVRRGRVDLAIVGAPVWDVLGVNAFRGLLAPFLVDSLALERRILDVQTRDRLLRSVEPLGLVGLAVLPGGLRRPAGISHAIVHPADYRGATIGVIDGGVARATFRALGATTKSLPSGTFASVFCCGVDGAELSLLGVADNSAGPRGELARAVTANVVFWPGIDTTVISRRAFERLSPTQQEALRRAGREAFDRKLARLQQTEQRSLSTLCQRGLRLVAASPADVAALRAAVQPVYATLERDAPTRALIARIRGLRAQVPVPASERPACPGTVARAVAGAARLEGRWRTTATPDDIRAADAPRVEKERFLQLPSTKGTIELRDGRWVGRAGGAEFAGTYAVTGDVVRFTIRRCRPAAGCDPGSFTDYAWSLYRGKLTLERIPGRWAWPAMVAKPWVRVG
jgi:TRAP-type C4-dicarboxylate transport system substrate-binding protein